MSDGTTATPSEESALLSIVIPCYNCADVISEQLEALADQEWPGPAEVLVVDNGSRDGLADVVASFRPRLPGLRLIEALEVRGSAHARNVGVTEARGERIVFLDADDVVAPGYVTAMAAALARHDLVASRIEYERLNSPEAARSRPHGQRDGLQEYRNPPFLPHANGASLGVRKDVHEAIQGFNESLQNLQDTDYCWRAQLSGYELVFVPDAVLHYRLRPDLRSVFRQARRYGRYNVWLYKEYRHHGMERPSLRRALHRWFDVAKGLPVAIVRPHLRLRYARKLAWTLGRLEGCILFRVFAP